jgi:CubicO group peptidase (beta-lactamase class C family)
LRQWVELNPTDMTKSYHSSQQLIERYIAEGHFAGAAVIAARNNRIVLEHYTGMAAPHLPSSPSVLWPVASISKLYSVAMVMRLVEQGALTLNTLACHVLPKFTGEGRESIRLRHLLTHTSGLIYESPNIEAQLMGQTPLPMWIEEAMTAPLLFKPGTSISYADYNTLIAGHLAEVVTGQPFAQLVRELVIEPMGLRDTFMPPPAHELSRIAKVRGALAEGTDGAMYNSAYALGLAHPAFGTVTTARDLLRFSQHFVRGGPRIHSEVTVRAMTTDQAGGVRGAHISLAGTAPHARIPWGLGWALQTADVPAVFCDLASHRTFGHGGATGCQFFVDPENDIIVAVLSNTHVRVGRDAWMRRLQSMVNVAFVEAAEQRD